MVRIEEAYDNDMDLSRVREVAVTAINALFPPGMVEWETFE